LEDGRVFCHRCILTISAQEGRTEHKERELKEEARRAGLERKWKPTYLQVVLTVGAVLLATMLGLRFYWSRAEVPPPQIHLNPSEPLELLADLQLALGDYAAEHEDSYPATLSALIPEQLADTVENRKVLEVLTYELGKDSGYRLQVKKGAQMSGQGLVATSEGIEPTEEGSGQ
jgi:hypothetical protein